MARTKAAVRELRVVLDTNVLYTSSPSELLKAEVHELIKSNKIHSDLAIKWHLPEVVINERNYQMVQKATELLPGLNKLERLLNHNLAINEETLATHVEQNIKKQIKLLDINPLPVDHLQIDWQRLISDATCRRPPFDSGEKEKGFRDALILESFVQLVSASPKSASTCRIVLVTNDGLLSTAAIERTRGSTNATILNGLDDLRGLINTMASQVTEEYIDSLAKKARALFFINKDHTECLYYKEKIRNRINDDFASILDSIPEGAESRMTDGITINEAQFVKKDGQRIHWMTRVRFKAKAYRNEQRIAPDEPVNGGLLSQGFIQHSPAATAGANMPLSRLYGLLPPEKKLTGTGYSLFQVDWSVSVDRNKKLSKPTIDRIEHVETLWE